MKDKFIIISELLKKIPKNKYPRILIISDKQLLYCHKGFLSINIYARSQGVVSDLGFDRGSILKFFSIFEFLINELIIKILKPSDFSRLDDLLNYVDLFAKIKLLNRWKIISNEIKEKSISAISVRNAFAHSWAESDIEYNNSSIELNFSAFRNDLEEIWNFFIEKYKEFQPDIDIVIKNLQSVA
ncbi:MAG: hypothetical protein WC715_00105 [Patescibacteria group bacterium]|jgi:hypothetical protein